MASEAIRARRDAEQRELGYQRAEREIAALRAELAERTAEWEERGDAYNRLFLEHAAEREAHAATRRELAEARTLLAGMTENYRTIDAERESLQREIAAREVVQARLIAERNTAETMTKIERDGMIAVARESDEHMRRADAAEAALAEMRHEVRREESLETVNVLRVALADERAKLADVLRRVREFVSKILAEPTVERQVRAMIPEAFEPQGEGDDNDDR